MMTLTYIAVGLLIIAWFVLIIMFLSSKAECDRLEEMLVGRETKNQNHSPSKTSAP